MKKLIAVAAATLALAGGVGAATLATTSTVPVTITVPYTVGDQTGQVVVTKDVDVPVETVTQTVTVTAPTTTTAPPPPPPTETSPPPPSSPTALTGSQCTTKASVAGAVIDNVTVSGGCTIGAANVTLSNATLSGQVSIRPAASGFKMLSSSSRGFELKGADNVLLDGNTFDGLGKTDNNEIYDEPNGNTPDGWIIRNNTFKNFYVNDGSTHSEAMFIGYSKNGLIEGNTFTNNGNTGHLFFTWWGGVANPSTSYPRNICIRGNTFNATWDAYYDANFRDEIPTSAGIKLQRDASTGWPRFYADC